jgi:hypothetical protein
VERAAVMLVSRIRKEESLILKTTQSSKKTQRRLVFKTHKKRYGEDESVTSLGKKKNKTVYTKRKEKENASSLVRTAGTERKKKEALCENKIKRMLVLWCPLFFPLKAREVVR